MSTSQNVSAGLRPIAAPMNGLVDLFASMKLSVVLLLLIACTSVAGSLIPQNLSADNYRQLYHPVVHKFLKNLDAFDIYHSVWFTALLVLLVLNILICTCRHLSRTWKILIPPKSRDRRLKISSYPIKQEITDPRNVAQLEKVCLAGIHSCGSVFMAQTADGFIAVAEKGRWTRMGVYAVHLSIVLLLLGGLYGSMYGYSGQTTVIEGMRADHIKLQSSGQTKKMNFAIRCDKFTVRFHQSGAAEEYRSSLTLFDQGKAILKKDVLVNDPLTYQGIKISQFSYGTVAPNEISFSFKSGKSGLVYDKKLQIGATYIIPEALGRFCVDGIVNSHTINGHNVGEAVIATLTHENQDAKQIVLPFRFKQFDRMRKDIVTVSITGFTPRYYTVLGISRDPGTPIVYAAFILLIAGCMVTFFTSHQKIGIQVSKASRGTNIRIAGTANKHRYIMHDKIKRIAAELARTQPHCGMPFIRGG